MSRARLWLALLVCAILAISCGGGPFAMPPDYPQESSPATPQPADPADGAPEDLWGAEPPFAPDSVAQVTASSARGLEVMTAPGELPRLQVGSDGASKITLKKTQVEASITGLVADVEVRQTYENKYTTPIETTYIFPLPQNAAVYRMTMLIGARKIEALVKEREAARRTYEAARNAGQTAALLSQERPNIFTQSVANIEPGKSIDIVVRYVQDLTYDEGQIEMVFPMVVGPRYMPGAPLGSPSSGDGAKADTTQVPDASRISPPILGQGERTGQDIALAVTVRGATSLRELETPTHMVTTAQSADGFRVALSAKDKIPNRDFVMRYRVNGEKPVATLYQSGTDSGYFSLVVHPPALDVNELVGRREIIFVVDVSGSMHGQPLSLCKHAMREALSQLRPVDTFNVITFSGATGQLFAKPRRANEERVQKARQYIDRMSAGGGTEMLNAVSAALSPDVEKGRHRYVFFMTDGYVGNDAAIISATGNFVSQMEAKGQRARVFGFGVGSSPNRLLMDGIARKGRGVTITATNREDPALAVNRFFRYIDRSVLRDITVDFAGLGATEMMPRKLPDLFASRALIVHGRFTGKAKGPIVVRGSGARGAVEIPVRVAQGPSADGWPTLALLWARSRITWLDDGLTEDPAARAEITKLGVDYHLVTQFTSLVAVDSSKVVSNGAPAKVTVPVEVPEGVDPVAAGAAGVSGRGTRMSYEPADDGSRPASSGGSQPAPTARARVLSVPVAADPAPKSENALGGSPEPYVYEFSDDAPLDVPDLDGADIRVRPGPVMMKHRSISADEAPGFGEEAAVDFEKQPGSHESLAAPPPAGRGPRGCNCDLAGAPSLPGFPWLSLGLVALLAARRRRRARLDR